MNTLYNYTAIFFTGILVKGYMGVGSAWSRLYTLRQIMKTWFQKAIYPHIAQGSPGTI